jgi:hypothetical protein
VIIEAVRIMQYLSFFKIRYPSRGN